MVERISESAWFTRKTQQTEDKEGKMSELKEKLKKLRIKDEKPKRYLTGDWTEDRWNKHINKKK